MLSPAIENGAPGRYLSILNFQRHRGDVAGFANAWPRRRQMRQLPVEQRPVAGDPIEANIILFKVCLPAEVRPARQRMVSRQAAT